MLHDKVPKKQIRKAGDNLAAGLLSGDERLKALELVGHWRAAHIEPLHQTLLEIERICGNDASTILVSRLKRIDTIVNKLGRESIKKYIHLDTLHDVAGCRLIVDNEDEVLRYADLLSRTDMFHQPVDHMTSPKAIGVFISSAAMTCPSMDTSSLMSKCKYDLVCSMTGLQR